MICPFVESVRGAHFAPLWLLNVGRPRIRSIKPEIWGSRDFQALSITGRLAFIALISNSDDEGRLKTDPAHLTTNYLTGSGEAPLVADVARQLDVMEEHKMAITYSARGTSYVALLGWKHQRVDHPVTSELPEPPKFKRRGSLNKRQLDLGILASSPERSRRIVSDRIPIPNGSYPDHKSDALSTNQAGELCALLTDALHEWGAKGETTTAWLTSADRLLRIDKRPYDEARKVLFWATHDESFWRANIRSMPTFREKYDTLRGQMMRRPSKSSLERSVEEDLQAAAQLRLEGR